MYSGANLWNSALMDSTSSHMGALTFVSKISFRGRNQSRSLWRFRPRKNFRVSGGKPGNMTDILR